MITPTPPPSLPPFPLLSLPSHQACQLSPPPSLGSLLPTYLNRSPQQQVQQVWALVGYLLSLLILLHLGQGGLQIGQGLGQGQGLQGLGSGLPQGGLQLGEGQGQRSQLGQGLGSGLLQGGLQMGQGLGQGLTSTSANSLTLPSGLASTSGLTGTQTTTTGQATTSVTMPTSGMGASQPEASTAGSTSQAWGRGLGGVDQSYATGGGKQVYDVTTNDQGHLLPA